MATSIDDQISRLGLKLPQAAAPAANYVPATITGDLLFISGQVSIDADGQVLAGHLGHDVSLADGQRAARVCALNILSQARTALDGDLERIVKIVRITGFVSSAPDFTEQHLVINGASDLLVDVLGEAGRHTRAAFGVAALPLGAAVEIDAIIEIRS